MILDVLKKNLIESQKSRDAFRVEVLRYLISAIKNKEIELRPQGVELDDEKIVKVINKQIAQRKDSMESYKAGNRQDLVEKEGKELAILEEILQGLGASANA
ncbi:GatB/YqeY domain-containing protein [Patescibacteria group bacterium]|nr:GatB/YqeY domain-containing protein [Patescibacteria group bacterium]